MDISKMNTDKLIIKRASSRLTLNTLISKIGKANKGRTCMQLFDPNCIINNTHIIGSYHNALLSLEAGTNKANSIAMEMLLFASFTDQIKSAVSMVGAKSSKDFIVFSNEGRSFNRIKSNLSNIRDFNPSTLHVRRIAKKLGIEIAGKKTMDESILEKLTLSRLELSS